MRETISKPMLTYTKNIFITTLYVNNTRHFKIKTKEGGTYVEKEVKDNLMLILEDWSWMQNTEGDEGSEWAEKLETDFYRFIRTFETWLQRQLSKPFTIEEAESLSFVQEILETLPAPLQLNFLNELERIVDGEEDSWYD